MERRFKLLIFSTIGLFTFTACQPQKQAQQPNQLQHEKPSIVFSAKTTAEYGQEVDMMKYVVSGYWDDIELPSLNTSMIGEQDLIFKLKGNNKELEKHLKVSVLDTQKPVLDVASDRVELQQGSTLDLSQFKASDSVDGELAVQLKEELDTNVAGEHKAVIFATDKNGNTTEREIVVNVVSTEIASQPNTPSSENTGYTSNNSSYTISSNNNTAVVTQPSQSTQPSQPEPTPAPVEPVIAPNQIGNSGMIFYFSEYGGETQALNAADAWADYQLGEFLMDRPSVVPKGTNGYSITSVFYTDGKVRAYTVSWY